MFELISRRYQNKSTLVTNHRPFAEGRGVPQRLLYVPPVDRPLRRAVIVSIEGEQGSPGPHRATGAPATQIMGEPEWPPAHCPLIVQISRFWSPEEALVVFGLFGDLRDKILGVHGDQLREELQAERGQCHPNESGDTADDGRPVWTASP
jgi:hypothetical protein